MMITKKLLALCVSLSAIVGLASGAEAQSSVSFSKSFLPATIGPGSVSTLTFTITNTTAAPVTDLDFTDNLPAGMTVADTAAATTCSFGTLTAAASGTTIAYTAGQLAAGSTCTVTANVTAATPGAYVNTSGDLTSSAGNSGPASDTLTVDAARPGFTKSFAPSSITLGATSTLTFTIDNSLNGSGVNNLDFTDVLPAGMEVASPANASTTCTGGTLTAPDGGTTVSYSPAFSGDATLSAGATCTVLVEVTGTAVGAHLNQSGDLTSFSGLMTLNSGSASDTLTVTGTPAGSILITKDFTDDPVAPGGTATLEFTLSNTDRDFAASSVAFTDDLTTFTPTPLSTGAVYSSELFNDCGGAVGGVGTTSINFSGGSIAPTGSCTIRAALSIPTDAGPGSYTNTTGAVTGMINGAPVTGNMAANNLTVLGAQPLVFTKSFTPDPVSANGTVGLEFTITNPNPVNGGFADASDITFTDELTTFLPFPVAATLPVSPCGGSIVPTSPFGDNYVLSFSGGSVAEGATCSFTVSIDIPADMPGGTYTNTTSTLVANMSDAGIISSPPASDTLTVNAGANITFTKEFTDDPVAAGGTANLRFTITSAPESLSPATSLAFTDDLGAMLSGAVAIGLPLSGICDSGTSSISGTGTLTFSASNVAPGESCVFNVPVSVPAGAATGDYTNSTSSLTATVATLPVTVPAASDDLSVLGADNAPLTWTKEFLFNPVLPGDTTTLRFTITNPNPTTTASITFFTDSLSSALPGLAASGPATVNTCGGTLSGTTFLTYTGGSVPPGPACTIEVPISVPAGASAGSYSNVTSGLSHTVLTAQVTAPATDTLEVIDEPLTFTKSFTNDPVLPGGVATLQFDIENIFPAPATSVSFTDDLGAMLTGATFGGEVSDTCGAASTGTSVYDSGTFTVPGNSSCTIVINVNIPAGAAADNYLNTTSNLSATFGSGPPPLPLNLAATAAPGTGARQSLSGGGFSPIGLTASDTLTVTTTTAPTFTKAFSPATVVQGFTSTLTFTIDNTVASPLSGLRFSDDLDTMFPGATVSGLPATPCGGASTIAAVGSLLTINSVDLAADGGPGDSCTFAVTVNVPAGAPLGAATNTTSALSDGASNLAPPATAGLTVIAPTPPVFSKSFSTNPINIGDASVLTFTIDNSGSPVEAATMAFTDTFPAGMVVASSPNVTNACGGTFTANATDGSVSLSGGLVAELASCTISVRVQALVAGVLANDAGTLTSNLPESGNATDSLTVNEVPLGLSMAFAPATILQSQTSTVTFAMRNTAVIAASSITFSDVLPANVVIAPVPAAATTCSGGTLTAPAGGGTISYSGGGLAAGAGCTITVNVTSAVVGTYLDTTETLTSSLGTSAAASATLTVEAPTDGLVTFVQNSDTDGTFNFSSTEPLFTFLMEVNGGTGSQGPISAPGGSYSISARPPAGVALTAIACDDTDSTGDATSGVISLNLAVGEAIVCTLTAQSSLQRTVDTINRFLTKRADLILTSEPDRNRRINRLINGGGNSSPLTFSNGDLKSLLPFTAEVGRGTGGYKFSTSLLQVRQAAASLELAHGSTKDAVFVNNYRFDAWFEAQYKKFDAGTEGAGHFAIAYMGADYLLTPNVLIGALLQVDSMEDVSAALGSTASGNGWMIGPYMTARLAPNLYFDARIAGGASTNRVSPFNTYTDNFNTQRWLAVASLTGEFERGPWVIRPNASLKYFEETQGSYVDSVGATIPSQTVQLGQFQIGPTFVGHFEGEDGAIYAPYFSIDAIYNIGQTTGVTVSNPTTPSTEGWRARLKAGIRMTTEDGMIVGIGSTYDGIGRSGFSAFGVSLDVSIPLKKAKAR